MQSSLGKIPIAGEDRYKGSDDASLSASLYNYCHCERANWVVICTWHGSPVMLSMEWNFLGILYILVWCTVHHYCNNNNMLAESWSLNNIKPQENKDCYLPCSPTAEVVKRYWCIRTSLIHVYVNSDSLKCSSMWPERIILSLWPLHWIIYRTSNIFRFDFDIYSVPTITLRFFL